MKNENIDCVKMKDDIQKKLLEETNGMSHEEYTDYFEKKMSKDSILGPLWKSLKERQSKKAS